MRGTLRGVILLSILGSVVVAGTVPGVVGGTASAPETAVTAAGSAGGPPLADAGLDQTVPQETTVYLDGGGSVSPDARILAYDWEIERPDGSTGTPHCTTTACVRASFVPRQLGVYAVTLTVLDANGETGTDTLYVTVTDREPPAATLNGPDRLSVGESGTFRLQAAPGDAPLSSVVWTLDGERHSSSFVERETEWELTEAFDDPGTYTVGGTVTDITGLDAQDSHSVTVGPATGSPYFTVDITDTNSPVTAGDRLEISGRVENTGSTATTQTVTAAAAFAEETATAEVGPLDPEERDSVTFTFGTAVEDTGTHEVTIASENDSATEAIDVREDIGPYFDVTITNTSSPVSVGDPLEAAVRVSNTGETVDEQDVVLSYSGERRDSREAVELTPGEEQVFTLGWVTDADDEGVAPITARTENATDSQEVRIGSRDAIEPVEITPVPPEDSPSEEFQFAVLFENTGDISTDSTASLGLPNKDDRIGTVETPELAPGEGWTAPLSAFTWPSGDNGWHQYDGETVGVRAVADSALDEEVELPTLPTFQVEFGDDNLEVADDRRRVAVRQASVTNTGDLPGRMETVFTLEEAEAGSTGVKDTLSDQNRGIEYVELDPGETYSVGRYPSGQPELYYTPTAESRNADEITVSVSAKSVRDWSGGIHDSETASAEWDTDSGTPDPEPCELGDSLEVEHADYAVDGELISITVTRNYCDENGVIQEDELNANEFQIEYYRGGSEAGSAWLTSGSDFVRGMVPPNQEEIGLAFRVYTSQYNLDTVSGARWFKDRENIPN